MSNTKPNHGNADKTQDHAKPEKTDNKKSEQERKHEQDLLDEGIEESFPASDTPTVSRSD